jgi:hypothetical protein
MADKLRPGGMGAKGSNGDPIEFQNSMAASIESALNALLEADHLQPPPGNNNSDDTRHRRRLFVAIAQGIVRHLVANPDAFVVVDAANNPTELKVQINSDEN